MKKALAILLLLAITFQVCGKLFVAGWFAVNRQQLTELFCINKQKPESKCNGNCFLNKKLKETDQDTQKDASGPVKVKSGTEEVWFCESNDVLQIPALSHIVLVYKTPTNYSFLDVYTIFQPPRA